MCTQFFTIEQATVRRRDLRTCGDFALDWLLNLSPAARV